jgi:uncharacterized membrane protein YhaH (DUF805 family)
MDLQTFTSFEGRISRKTFWLAFLVLLVVSWILQFIAFAIFGGSVMAIDPNMSPEAQAEAMESAISGLWLPLGLVILLTLWPSLAVYTKRWHDRNKSGWWSLILFVPIIGSIWMLVELGFLRGTDGTNTFGPDPIGD